MTDRERARGFTLIELVVVVGIIALLAALAAPALGAFTGADARRAAGELAGGMRFVFDTAALRHVDCRLALDLDASAWWCECRQQGAAGGSAASGGGGDGAGGAEEESAELERRFPGEKNAELRALLAKTDFAAFGDPACRKRELPGSTKFAMVQVEGRRDAADGRVYVRFFRGGQAERANVIVGDGDFAYTVLVEPFTGRARVEPGKKELRE